MSLSLAVLLLSVFLSLEYPTGEIYAKQLDNNVTVSATVLESASITIKVLPRGSQKDGYDMQIIVQTNSPNWSLTRYTDDGYGVNDLSDPHYDIGIPHIYDYHSIVGSSPTFTLSYS